MTTRDERLEEISDRIRHGIPVGILEALAAIDYQESLKAERAHNKWWKRLNRWMRMKP